MTNESDYVIKNPKLVFDHFNELLTKKCLVSAYFGDNNSAFLTAIVNLDPKNELIQLDCGPTDALDQQLLTSSKVSFGTEVEGIKVCFSGKNIKKVRNGSDWVFSMPIPETIFWMQRRKFYRVRIPLSHRNSYCQITFDDGGRQETVNFPIYDISITGISFLNQNPNWAEYFQPDNELTDCILHLHNGNQMAIGFTVKNNVQIRINTLSFQDKIGCLLHPLTPSFETNIQRYMQEIELQKKKFDKT